METIPCVLCGSSDADPVCATGDRLRAAEGRLAPASPGPAATFTLVRCRGCGLVYLDPRPTAAEIGGFYPDDYHTAHGTAGPVQRLEDAWRRRQFAEVARWLAELRPGRGRLLDIGCGSGELLEALRDDGWRVSGVEPSARSAEIARTQRGLDVQTAAFDDASLPESSYDVVVFAAALEHLHDPVAALTRARRLLTPGGLVAVLFLPLIDAPQARLFGPRWIGLDLPRHLYQFGTHSFAAAADAAGLRVVSTKPYSRRHSPAFWTASLFPGLQKQRLNLTAPPAPSPAPRRHSASSHSARTFSPPRPARAAQARPRRRPGLQAPGATARAGVGRGGENPLDSLAVIGPPEVGERAVSLTESAACRRGVLAVATRT